jgi:hypothetical protein
MTLASMVSHAQTRTLRWVYLALVVLGSIGAHLASEFGAMGRDAGEVALSPRHVYLGVAAIVSLAFAIRELLVLRAASSSSRDFKRRIEMGLSALPFAGKRYFGVATAGLFLLIGGATEIGEGCPIAGHDIWAGVFGALICSLGLALAVRAFTRRLPSIAAALLEFVPARRDRVSVSRRHVIEEAIPLSEFLWYAHLECRPPPVPAAIR